MRQDIRLFLFTDFFPYTLKEEAFLETEIQYLAKEFSQVYIVSTKADEYKRPVPGNVTVYAYDNLKKNIKIKNGFALISFIKMLFYGVLNEPKKIKQLLNLRSYFYHFRTELRKTKTIHQNFTFQSGDILYAYWFNSWLLSLVMLPQSVKEKVKIISRAHRWDLYDEEAGVLKFIPFRNLKLKYAECVYCISKEGYNYMQEHVKKRFHKKIRLAYLGVTQAQKINPKGTTGNKKLHFVSCSRVVGFKRVETIYSVFAQLKGFEIEWTHFGDGPLFRQLQDLVKDSPSHLTIHLKGDVKNQDVLEFYKDTHIDYFISMSRSEGLPVSMMEAIAHGIPIIAIGVNGVPEIVNDKTGLLLSPDITIEQIVKQVHHFLLKKPHNRKEIVNFYNQNFNSDSNYMYFCNEIKSCLCNETHLSQSTKFW